MLFNTVQVLRTFADVAKHYKIRRGRFGVNKAIPAIKVLFGVLRPSDSLFVRIRSRFVCLCKVPEIGGHFVAETVESIQLTPPSPPCRQGDGRWGMSQSRVTSTGPARSCPGSSGRLSLGLTGSGTSHMLRR
jgi:hypothetical protein